MPNNKQVTAEYYDFKDAVSDQNGIKPACRLCGKIIAASWQGREDSREKGIWNADHLQRHLIEWHNTEWTSQIEPRMKFKLTPINARLLQEILPKKYTNWQEWSPKALISPAFGAEYKQLSMVSSNTDG
jgi:hypothetical protein